MNYNKLKVLGKKIYITDQAIDKVRYVDIPTHTKEENQFIQEQHKKPCLKMPKKQ